MHRGLRKGVLTVLICFDLKAIVVQQDKTMLSEKQPQRKKKIRRRQDLKPGHTRTTVVDDRMVAVSRSLPIQVMGAARL